jgi:hypothetical protein
VTRKPCARDTPLLSLAHLHNHTVMCNKQITVLCSSHHFCSSISTQSFTGSGAGVQCLLQVARLHSFSLRFTTKLVGSGWNTTVRSDQYEPRSCFSNQTYTAVEGDTCKTISEKMSVDTNTLQILNSLYVLRLLKPGSRHGTVSLRQRCSGRASSGH